MYKVYYARPNYKPGTESCDVFVCHCIHAIWQDPPLLYNIATDPSEKTPLDTSQPKYARILEVLKKAVKKHEASIAPVTNQFHWAKTIWNPLLQPCCNFPYCSCKDKKYSKQ